MSDCQDRAPVWLLVSLQYFSLNSQVPRIRVSVHAEFLCAQYSDKHAGLRRSRRYVCVFHVFIRPEWATAWGVAPPYAVAQNTPLMKADVTQNWSKTGHI